LLHAVRRTSLRAGYGDELRASGHQRQAASRLAGPGTRAGCAARRRRRCLRRSRARPRILSRCTDRARGKRLQRFHWRL